MKTTNNTINMPALGFGTLITKLWNTNHRPERVAPAFEASLKRLRLDYLDCYLMHTRLRFSRATSRTQGMRTVRSFMMTA